MDDRRREVPQADLEPRLVRRGEDRPFSEALVRPGLSLIAEFKRRSPSAGEIAADAGVADQVAAYERGGAAALSVLTDERHFGGSLDDLRAARAACDLPILRKDFIVDPYQLYEAAVERRRRGAADRRAPSTTTTSACCTTRRAALDLDCLVEVHDEPELERALELDAEVIGINNRDLDDGTVDVSTHVRADARRAGRQDGRRRERDLGAATELEELERVGVDAVLIGGALMRAADPEAKTRELTGADEGTREHLSCPPRRDLAAI